MTTNDIQLELRGQHTKVALVRLTRASKRNACSDALVALLRQLFEQLPHSVRAAVLPGNADHFKKG